MGLVASWPRGIRAGFAVAALLVATYLLNALLPGGLGPAGALLERFSWTAMAVVASGLCLARALHSPDERAGWSLVAAGIAAYGFGWLYFMTGAGGAFPTVGDGAWLAYYPLVYAGLAIVARSRLRGAVSTLWLDGLIGALTLAAAGAALVYAPLRDATGGSSTAVIVAMSYGLADIHQLCFVVAILLTVGRGRRAPWVVIAAGMLTAVVADAVYAYELPSGTFSTGDAIDAGWLVLMLAPAAAAWMPAGRREGVNMRAARRLHVPAAFASIALGLQSYATVADVDRSVRILTTGALLVTAARLAGAYREMRRLEHAAGRDALTGLRNRGEFHATVDHHVADHGSEPFSVVFFDLDGFKEVNDTYGHAEGDRVLREVSEALERGARDSDEVFRLGGDEFALLLPRADVEQAGSVAERIRATVEAMGGVGLSYGVAEWLRHADDKDRLLLHADEALYAAKAQRPDAPRPGVRRVAGTSRV